MRLVSELDTADQRAQELAKGLTPLQLNWQPRQDSWSVGQCLEHLRVANEVYLPAIAASLTARPLVAVQHITPGWFGRWFIRNYIEPSSESKRARAHKKIAPSTPVDPHILDLSSRATRPYASLSVAPLSTTLTVSDSRIPLFPCCVSLSERGWKSSRDINAAICCRLKRQTGRRLPRTGVRLLAAVC
jgi:hypothetical protein